MLTKSKLKPTIKPPSLKSGAKVGLVSPASRPESPAVVAHAQRIVRELGFEPVLGRNVLSVDGFLAGDDNERLDDFNAFIRDPSIGALFCITGGYGSLRLLNGIDYDGLTAQPKIIAGADENTCVLNAVYSRTGLVTFHAPNLDKITSRDAFDSLKRAVADASTLPMLKALRTGEVGGGSSEFYCSHGGSAEGHLVGGNLTALGCLLGTDFEPYFRGGILFLEDFDERNGTLDRWFTSLYLGGHLQYASAVALGKFEKCTGRDSFSSLSSVDLLGDRLKYLQKVSCFGLPISNGPAGAVVPIGIKARLNANKGILEFIESALA